MAFPKQLYARYRFGDRHAQSLQAGRLEFNDASELAPKDTTLATLKRDRVSQRLIGTFGWSDVGRSFDGLRYSWSQPRADVTIVAATPTRGVFQTDGWGWNRIGFAYGAFTKEWGHGNHAADTRFFAIDYDDFRHILKTDNRPLAVRKGDTENIHIQTWGGPQPPRRQDDSGDARRLGLGGSADGPLGNTNAACVRAGFRRRLPTGHFAVGQAVDSRGLHDRLGGWQSERPHARNILPDPADAAALCEIPVLQHDEH